MIIIFNSIHFLLLHPYLTMSQFFNHGFSLSKLHSITCMAVLDWIFGNTETIMLLKSEIWHHWLSWIYVVINLFSASSFTSSTLYWKIDVWKSESLLKTVCQKGACIIISLIFNWTIVFVSLKLLECIWHRQNLTRHCYCDVI